MTSRKCSKHSVIGLSPVSERLPRIPDVRTEPAAAGGLRRRLATQSRGAGQLELGAEDRGGGEEQAGMLGEELEAPGEETGGMA